jgi:hypothetical protein
VLEAEHGWTLADQSLVDGTRRWGQVHSLSLDRALGTAESDFGGKIDEKTPPLFDNRAEIHQNKRLIGDFLYQL